MFGGEKTFAGKTSERGKSLADEGVDGRKKVLQEKLLQKWIPADLATMTEKGEPGPDRALGGVENCHRPWQIDNNTFPWSKDNTLLLANMSGQGLI